MLLQWLDELTNSSGLVIDDIVFDIIVILSFFLDNADKGKLHFSSSGVHWYSAQRSPLASLFPELE